jgi:hypothetical protein
MVQYLRPDPSVLVGELFTSTEVPLRASSLSIFSYTSLLHKLLLCQQLSGSTNQKTGKWTCTSRPTNQVNNQDHPDPDQVNFGMFTSLLRAV